MKRVDGANNVIDYTFSSSIIPSEYTDSPVLALSFIEYKKSGTFTLFDQRCVMSVYRNAVYRSSGKYIRWHHFISEMRFFYQNEVTDELDPHCCQWNWHRNLALHLSLHCNPQTEFYNRPVILISDGTISWIHHIWGMWIPREQYKHLPSKCRFQIRRMISSK